MACGRRGARLRVEVGFVECERLADPQPGAPEHDDHAAQADPIRAISRGAYDRDDLLHRRRAGG